MWLKKLAHGFLQVQTESGLRYVRLSFRERLQVAWTFRHFSIISRQVLSDREQRCFATLCDEQRMSRCPPGEADRDKLIDTLTTMLSPFSNIQERRMQPRTAASFEVRYGSGHDLVAGQGCNISDGGMQFIGSRAYPPGAEITVQYRMDPHAVWITTRALVRYCTHDHIGVEFLRIQGRRKE